jgi:myxalamid-type polyketide synthase MxaB
VVQGKVVFPGTGYLETLLALQDAVYGDTRRPVVGMRVREPLFLTDEETEVRTRLRPGEDGRPLVEIASRVRGEGEGEALERVHATASLGEPEPEGALSEAGRALCAEAAQAGEPDEVLGEEEIYAAYHGGGLQYGPEFRRMPQVARHGLNLAIGSLRGWPAGALEHVPPPLADSATHAFAAIGNDGNSYLPVRYARFRMFKKPRAQRLRVLLRIDPAQPSDVDISIDLVALEGDQPVFELRGLGIKRVADPAGVRQSLVNDLRWLKRSLVGSGDAAAARRVLVVHAGAEAPEALVRQARAAGVALSVAGTTEQVTAALRGGHVSDVCWVWQRGPEQAEPTARALRDECERNYRDVLELLGLLGREGFGRDQRLWLVTERGQLVPGDEPPPAPPASATLWGFGHSLLNEQPALRTTLVDLSSNEDRRLLLPEFGARGGGDFQIAYRNGHRYTRRLVPVERPGGIDPDGNFELAIKEYGQFGNIRAVPVPDERPAGDQVLVEVHAAGLNFKDVLNALGLLREFGEQPLGFEAAGTVVAAGPAATHRVGDPVVVNYLGCMRRRVIVPSALAAPKPGNVTFAEAAGLAAAYVTAHYALHTLAGMKAGDKVLIHAAAGGVGQAAVQLARSAGAEVFATASPHKWPVLRAQGVRHLMHSRTLDFADEILRSTGGSGVDIVLNSLNKDFIPASFRCLGTGGRFVELGKVGAWTPQQVRQARPDVAYHNFDLSELPWDEGVRISGEILRTVVGRVAAGELTPVPTTGYSLDEVEEAFGALSRGTNVGKLVLTFIADDAPAARQVTIDATHTYVITGGLGALGLLTAQRLVDLGARHVTLVGRGADPAPEVVPLAKRLRERAEVTVLQGDVADPDDMDRIVAALTAAGRPVGGIVHAAGSLADAPVSAQTWQSIDAVCRPKVYGAWLLHQAAQSFPDLKFFIGYSSAASVIGAPGQSNYAAANAFLDTLCRWRAAKGLPALSINWGPWGGVGMSARANEQVRKRWSEEGITLITPAAGMRALASLLDSPLPQAVVGAGDWARFAATRPVSNALYQRLAARDGGQAGAGIDLAALVAAPRPDRMAVIDEFIRGKVAQVLHFDDAGAVDSGTEFIRLGLDSLVAVELKNSLESAFGLPLPGSVALDYPSAELLTEFLDRQLVPEPAGSAL